MSVGSSLQRPPVCICAFSHARRPIFKVKVSSILPSPQVLGGKPPSPPKIGFEFVDKALLLVYNGCQYRFNTPPDGNRKSVSIEL